MSEKLKACPFCGGEAERTTIGADEPNNAGGDVICCTVCHASSHVEFGRKENLVSRWNTRPLSMTGDVVEALGELEQRATATLGAMDRYNEKNGTYIIGPSLLQLGKSVAKARAALVAIQEQSK